MSTVRWGCLRGDLTGTTRGDELTHQVIAIKLAPPFIRKRKYYVLMRISPGRRFDVLAILAANIS